jgi:hypothetical protein
MPELLAIPTYKVWSSGRILDQGNTPHCVGFGWAGWGISPPVQTNYHNADGHLIYSEAKSYDVNKEDGSSVRSGAKAMLKRGRIQAYYFAKTYRDALQFVGNHGPVVMGTNWYDGMGYPNKYAIVAPTGKLVGGHCWDWIGIDHGYAVCKNSWGTSYGRFGVFYMLLSDVELLYNESGEACAAVEKPYPTDKPLGLFSRAIKRVRR